MFFPSKIVLFGAFVALMAGLPRTVSGQGASIVPNGSFEADENKDGWPDGWPKGAGVTGEIEDGNRFLRITQSAAGAFTMAYLRIPVAPGVGRYRLSYRVRYRGILRGAESWHTGRIVLHFCDGGGAKLKPAPKHPSFVGDHPEWSERTQELTVPQGASFLEFMPALMNAEAGVLDLDDVLVVPLP